jgi:kumamolisin
MPSRKSAQRAAACLVFLGALAALAPAGAADSAAGTAVPYPTAHTPQAIDLGALETLSSTPITITVALSLQNPAAAEQLLESVSTPGNAQYRQFLTHQQFVARFAPTQATVAKAIAGLAKYNLTAEQVTSTTLHVTGLPADMERAFSVSLHSFQVPAHDNAPAYTFHAPVSGATVPAELGGMVSAVTGLDSRPALRPMNLHAPMAVQQAKPAGPGYTYNPPGSLTVTDFAHLYDVEPLYAQGLSGQGRTIGIMSLANFTPSDAYAYWSALGLTVNPHRISVVYVDGGPGAPSDVSGSLETTLDTEQSGGIAPGAAIIDYLAPNTNQAFVDVFAAAIEANIADTLSISWGEWEYWNNAAISPVIDPFTGETVSTTQAIHELLVEAAIQGQSVFTAQGDGGAYDAYNDLGCTGPYSPSQPDSCSLTLTVDYPGSDPAITSGGGTTLAATVSFCVNSTCTPPVVHIPHERVWGWDYFTGVCNALGYNIFTCGIFPVGGGGGVSITFPLPFYQLGQSGLQLTQPDQVFRAGSGFADDGIPLFYRLPAYFPGRNVPDVSFNADPYTGYVVYYTSSSTGFGIEPGWGGTSFVAPQLNGVMSLLNQDLQGRLGFLNPTLYHVQDNSSEGASIHPIAFGDNWFYFGRNGYAPAAGLGTLDVANFADYLRGPFF